MRTLTEKVFTDYFVSEKQNALPNWNLLEEIEVISGYRCHKATTELYGRKWTVWYAPEIARPDGPWLLRGLPGVVIKAEDDEGLFKFELYKIEQRSTPIVYNKKNYTKAERNKVLKFKRDYYKNRSQYIQNSAVITETSGLPKSSPTIPFNPLRVITD